MSTPRSSRVTIEGVERVSRRFAELAQGFKGPVLREGAMDGGLVMERHVKQEAPVTKGAYRAGIKTEETKATATEAEVEVGTNAAQAFPLEFGSGLHAEQGPKQKYPIEPDVKQFLAFDWPDAPPHLPRLPDGRVLIRKVNHPGIVAQPHFRPGYRKGKEPAIKAVKLALQRAMARFLRPGNV